MPATELGANTLPFLFSALMIDRRLWVGSWHWTGLGRATATSLLPPFADVHSTTLTDCYTNRPLKLFDVLAHKTVGRLRCAPEGLSENSEKQRLKWPKMAYLEGVLGSQRTAGRSRKWLMCMEKKKGVKLSDEFDPRW